MQCNKSEILEKISNTSSSLVCSASFDSRWAVIPEIVHSKMRVYVVTHCSYGVKASEAARFSYEPLNLTNGKPFDLWKDIAGKIIPIIQKSENQVTIDITAFDTETLLFIVTQIKALELGAKVKFVYLGADSYSTSLMSGVKSVRTVLGYPGIFSPSKKFHHLIILLGFELDRAKELILSYEPSSISIGIGEDCYKDDFSEQNRISSELVQDFVQSLGHVYRDVAKFCFSSKDAIQTKKAILDEAKKYEDSNILISPMNTKVSTVGAALAALENEELKLCYVEPLEYDTENYSEPGSIVTIFEFE
ncbi:hypothetical protein [Pseudoalteromonas xiamenensis]|uniref:Uncharacterized protein n=1 Tax=Pseudoalteromonas xiamenensis TaxID=882626 RepID=A0A975HJV5_9GAMM|nr:hypothetical protein [Pseudoalteromonas xiamenensis]QTH70314.1 hypothetical protein J5O05_09775 [Pseudoalteromonas xiamenensis]